MPSPNWILSHSPRLRYATGALALMLVRERNGERLLPWTTGEASPRNEAPPSFRQVFSDINHLLWTRASLIIMAIMFFDGLVGGYGRALMSIASVQVFNFTTPQWTNLNAIMGLTGAVLALGLGPLIDRFGAKSMMALTILMFRTHNHPEELLEEHE